VWKGRPLLSRGYGERFNPRPVCVRKRNLSQGVHENDVWRGENGLGVFKVCALPKEETGWSKKKPPRGWYLYGICRRIIAQQILGRERGEKGPPNKIRKGDKEGFRGFAAKRAKPQPKGKGRGRSPILESHRVLPWRKIPVRKEEQRGETHRNRGERMLLNISRWGKRNLGSLRGTGGNLCYILIQGFRTFRWGSEKKKK